MKLVTIPIVSILIIFTGNAQNKDALQKILLETNSTELKKMSESYFKTEKSEKESALKIAKEKGIPTTIKDSFGFSELYKIDVLGNPLYRTAYNTNAANYIKTSNIHTNASLGIALKGAGMKIGIWDGGSARASHEQFTGGRIFVGDVSSLGDHATHVAGTLIGDGIGTGTNAHLSKGMAPLATAKSFSFDHDASEMATEASMGLMISNHSYGYRIGWTYHSDPPSVSYSPNSYYFGRYTDVSKSIDNIAWNAPYYLSFFAAGNHRSDGFSGSHYHSNSSGVFNDAHPHDGDQVGSDYYDLIGPHGCAKNNLTVGAVNGDNGSMTDFSSFGPTDDGRVKPDLVTDGHQLYSSIGTSNNSYSSYSGTSMASPTLAGSALLLQEYYQRINSGSSMRSSTLKGLLINTATDIGNSGPDYRFGWGAANAETAATTIKDNMTHKHIFEEKIRYNNTSQVVTIINGTTTLDPSTFIIKVKPIMGSIVPLKATLCWIDPPSNAGPLTIYDDPTRKLINDFDLRIHDEMGNDYRPYVLNPAIPEALATNGDNIRDNVEQILINNPTPNRTYIITVKRKSGVTDFQPFSLIINGNINPSYSGYRIVSTNSSGSF